MEGIKINKNQNVLKNITSVVSSQNVVKSDPKNLEDLNTYTLFFRQHSLLMISNKESKLLNPQGKLYFFYKEFFKFSAENREFILTSLKESKNNLQQLKFEFKNFLKELDVKFLDYNRKEINLINKEMLHELLCKQFLFTLSCWAEESSPSSENTDLLIKKAIDTSFLLLDYTPIAV